MIVPDTSAFALLFTDDPRAHEAGRAAYDAGHVAAAEAHDFTLVTADVRIARAGVARCPVRTLS